MATLAARDPVELISRAREHVGRREWSEAAGCYAESLQLAPTDDGAVWFEYAASQLLAGDRAGYRLAAMWMTDEETNELTRGFLSLLQPYLDNPATPDRTRRILRTIVLPGPDSTPRRRSETS